MPRTEITPADILPMADYARIRGEQRRRMVALKRRRRLEVGPIAMVHFESYDTMLAQVHEMLFIEKGGAAQLADELDAYNPLVPKGRELVATLMFEIPEEARRHRILAGLGGVEHAVGLLVGDDRIAGIAEADVERTTADGKASSVHFLHFPFTDTQVAAFRDPGARVMLAIEHPNYGHAALLPQDLRAALAEDFT